MNRKPVVVLLLLALIILAGAPESFARPQYLTNLTAVYGDGSCGTCHVIASGDGQRDFNGTFGQHNSSNGTFERRDPNRTFAARSSNGTSRQRNSNRTLPLNSYGTLFKNQPDHATDPGAALIAIGQPPAAAPEDTAPAGAQAAPGFGFVAALVGLFACALLARRHNK
ncbi:Uncharacterised protein [uncultured archaeon]|nr:Uncharacterised protein [uncultured archaeon]